MDEKILNKAAETYGTPLYLFDLNQLRERVEMIRQNLGGHYRLCYAMKANPFLIQPLAQVVDGFEVCSPGEFRICEHTGIKMRQIVLSGVYKEKKDMLHAMETYGEQGTYTVESLEHLRLLEECAAETDVTVRVLIRVTSGNQFGVDEKDIHDIIRDRKSYTHIHIKGLQHYAGTQRKKLSRVIEELKELDEFIGELRCDYQYETEELEYGPGLYVPYFDLGKEDGWSDQEALKELKECLDGLAFQGQVTLEMGRYIAAYCGYYLTTIVDQKRNHGQNYCIVDGGINHLTYAGQTMGMKIPHIRHLEGEDARLVSGSKESSRQVPEEEENETEMWNICGSLCTVNDVIVKNLPLDHAKAGDILVFERAGAYAVTEGMYLFLSRDLPGIVFWSKESGMELLRERRGTDEINRKD